MNNSVQDITQRRNQLLNYIKNNQSISIAEVSQLLHVSSITIRRDLKALESENLIKRYRGGASLNKETLESETFLEEKKHVNSEFKQQIGAYIANALPNNSTVFLNSGTTTLAVLSYLENKSIKIITNNAMAPAVIKSDNIELILTGGECRNRSKSLVGQFAIETINNIYGNYCILGANGINEKGLTTSVYAETQVNDAMVQHCNGKVIVAADGSKIGKCNNFSSVPISKIDILVTDHTADKSCLEAIERAGIKIIVVS